MGNKYLSYKGFTGQTCDECTFRFCCDSDLPCVVCKSSPNDMKTAFVKSNKEDNNMNGMDKRFANQECSNCKFRTLPVRKASPCWDCYTLKYGRLSNWVADEENEKLSIGTFKDFMKEFTELCDKYNITSVRPVNGSWMSPRIGFVSKSVDQEFTIQKMYRSVGVDHWRVVSARIEPQTIDFEFDQAEEEK